MTAQERSLIALNDDPASKLPKGGAPASSPDQGHDHDRQRDRALAHRHQKIQLYLNRDNDGVLLMRVLQT